MHEVLIKKHNRTKVNNIKLKNDNYFKIIFCINYYEIKRVTFSSCT